MTYREREREMMTALREMAERGEVIVFALTPEQVQQAREILERGRRALEAIMLPKTPPERRH